MDRVELSLCLLKLKCEKEFDTLGENTIKSMIDDYYFSRDYVQKTILKEYPNLDLGMPFDSSLLKNFSSKISDENPDLLEYIDINTIPNIEENISLDEIVNIKSIENMYYPNDLGYGFGAEVIIPIILSAIQSIAAIVAIIIAVQQKNTSSSQLSKDEKLISQKIDNLINIIIKKDLTKSQVNQVLSQIEEFTKIYKKNIKR